jgi:hypothetical protein
MIDFGSLGSFRFGEVLKAMTRVRHRAHERGISTGWLGFGTRT